MWGTVEVVDVGENGVRCDSDRMLSEEGVAKTREAAKGARRFGCKPDRIISSPLIRSRQTAEIAAGILETDAEVELVDELSCGASASDIAGIINSREADSVMIVGHNPDFEEFVSYFIAGTEDGAYVEIKKASLCAIEFDGEARAGRGVLTALIPPKVLRALSD